MKDAAVLLISVRAIGAFRSSKKYLSAFCNLPCSVTIIASRGGLMCANATWILFVRRFSGIAAGPIAARRQQRATVLYLGFFSPAAAGLPLSQPLFVRPHVLQFQGHTPRAEWAFTFGSALPCPALPCPVLPPARALSADFEGPHPARAALRKLVKCTRRYTPLRAIPSPDHSRPPRG